MAESIEADRARLSEEYHKAVGGNNPTVRNNSTGENKEIPADDILGIMDAMSKHDYSNIFK